MKKDTIIGRVKEKERLDECMTADQAQLVIVYGRRRVGKTFLINEYFGNKFALKVTGTYGKGKDVQIRNFISSLNRQMHRKIDVPGNWYDVFELLRDYIETLDEKAKQVFFFDEMPWLDNQKSDFLPAFEWFWNDFAATRKNVVFIVCGSATSWMDEKIVNNKGGLFNRQTCKLYLQSFRLFEVEEYLKNKKIEWSRYDIIKCYMIMGGIPYYLSLLDKKLSFSQNVDKLFFEKGGELEDEFNHLYNTLFTNSDIYINVVEALSRKRSGLTRSELLKSIAKGTGGDISKVLNNLILSGFVRASSFYGKKKKDTLYQLCDFYTAFYFRYIKDNYGKDEHYWSNSGDSPSRKSWEGLVFEQICFDHVPQIKHKLGISGILTEQSSWFIQATKEEPEGAQIDMLIARRDKVISLCEIKFSDGEYTINKDYDLKLRNKAEVFRRATKCRDSIQLVMITTYGVKKNMYSSLINNEVTMDDLFVML